MHRKSRYPAVAAAAVVVVTLLVGATSGASATKAAAAAACNSTLTASVTLTADLNCPGTDGFIVGADGITINLGGHILSGDSTGGTRGIFDNGHKNVVIENGWVTAFQNDVQLVLGADGSKVEGLNLSSSSNPLVVSGSNNVLVTGNEAAFGTGPGIEVLSGAGDKVTGNIADQNSGDGILVGTVSKTLVSGNRAYNNGAVGIAVTNSDGTVTLNVSNSNGTNGFLFQDANPSGVKSPLTASKNRASFNANLGFLAQAFGVNDGGGNVVQSNSNALECQRIYCAQVSS